MKDERDNNEETIRELERRGYFWVKSNGDGSFRGHHGITKYKRLYLKDGKVYWD